MFIPKKAFVLAAGLGKRLRPLTLLTPKPLIQVGKTTPLEFVLSKLYAVGVDQVVINTHHLAEQIHKVVKDDPRVVISHEPGLLESGGAIRRMLHIFGDEPFYVINADYMWQEEPQEPLLKKLATSWHQDMKTLLTLVPKGMAIGYNGNGDYSMNNKGNIIFRTHTNDVAPFVCATIAIMDPVVYKNFQNGDVFSNKLVWDQLEKKQKLFGVEHNQKWVDIGSHKSLAEAAEIDWS